MVVVAAKLEPLCDRELVLRVDDWNHVSGHVWRVDDDSWSEDILAAIELIRIVVKAEQAVDAVR